MPDLQSVELAVADTGCLTGLRHDVLPVSSGKIDAVLFRISNVGLNGSNRVRLNPENIRAGAVRQIRLENIQILIGRNRLKIYGDTIGILESLDRRIITVVHPSGGYQNAQCLTVKLAIIRDLLDYYIVAGSRGSR